MEYLVGRRLDEKSLIMHRMMENAVCHTAGWMAVVQELIYH